MTDFQDFFKTNGLSVTESRRKILELFLASPAALAHADIELKTGANFDRVTVYRTLQTFVDKGIIHQIPTTDNSVLYALCRQACKAGHHHDNHVHFMCTSCNSTTCIDDVTVPQVSLPNGFNAQSAAMIISGTCRLCSI